MLVGRHAEQRMLRAFLDSDKAEFVVVYGRRRIGKTFLISEFFRDTFAFHATGLSEGSLKDQLRVFDVKLREYGLQVDCPSENWLEAFLRLKELLLRQDVIREVDSGRKVVFIDEMPWFDTPRSGFRSALEFFWNDWACRQKDLMLIVCGSATSWIVKNLLESTGGFHNRVTRIMDLQPFTFEECLEYCTAKNLPFTPQQILESQMIFGGVPFYLDLLQRDMSLAQSVDMLCFNQSGQLYDEFNRLYATLFKHPDAYINIVQALARKQSGLTRKELRAMKGFEGSRLTEVLRDLELCGFVRSYRDFTKTTRGAIYQLVDPFTLFYVHCMEPRKIDSWLQYVGTHSYYVWAGNAFEMFCLNNVDLLKSALGISGVQTSVTAWRSSSQVPGAQIDLLIDRRDGVINVCEMKYSRSQFVIDAAYERELMGKLAAFEEEVHPKGALYLTMVTANGVKPNSYYHAVVQNSVAICDLPVLRAR